MALPQAGLSAAVSDSGPRKAGNNNLCDWFAAALSIGWAERRLLFSAAASRVTIQNTTLY